jgi:hypothetical protein
MRIAAVLLCALAGAACKEREPAPSRPPPSPIAAPGDASVMRLVQPVIEARGAIDLTAEQTGKRPAGLTACALPAAGWSWPCGSRTFGQLAFDGDGRLYLTDADGGLRRYTVHAEGGCRLAEDASFADGGRLAPPPEREVAQKLDGQVHLRSGGPQWRLGGGGGAVYWHDYLLGVYRVDRGRLEPVCPELTGVRQITGDAGGVWMVTGDGIERLTAAKGCKRTPAEVVAASRIPVLGLAGGALHVTTDGDGGRAIARLSDRLEVDTTYAGVGSFDPGGLCSVVGIAACGDDLCVADNNCQKVNRYAAGGDLVAELKASDATAGVPYAVRAIATAPDGAALVTVDERDDKTCTARILRIAP